jgi:hypothetical protein
MTIESSKDSFSDPTLLLKDLNEFEIQIVEIENGKFGRFWAQIKEKEYINQLTDLQNRLNFYNKFQVIQQRDIIVGKLVTTLFGEEDSCQFAFYRAKIVEIISDNEIKVLLHYKYLYYKLN